jgi:hypothetical protein
MTPDELNALADECAQQHADYVLLPDGDLPDSGVILLHAAAALRAQAEVTRERDRLLSEGLDLCVRGRVIDAHSGNVPLWIVEGYHAALAEWETRARAALARAGGDDAKEAAQ